MVENWILELTLARTAVGNEFDFIKSTARKREEASFFGIYGYFDVAAISVRRRLRDDLFIPLHQSVRESVTIRAYPHRRHSSPDEFKTRVSSNWTACLAVLVKIHNHELKRIFTSGANFESVIDKVVEVLGDETYVFYGTGHSEFLVVTGGSDLPKMLENVTRLRKEKQDGDNHPLFSNTTTYPLISFSTVHKDESYQKLTGNIEPLVKIHCEPASEDDVRSSIADWTDMRGDAPTLKNIYGTQDLALTWGSPLVLSSFARKLTSWRNGSVYRRSIQNTTTFLQHTPPSS